MKKVMQPKNILTLLNALALALVVANAGTMCFWQYHQPEFPKEADKFRAFKN